MFALIVMLPILLPSVKQFKNSIYVMFLFCNLRTPALIYLSKEITFCIILFTQSVLKSLLNDVFRAHLSSQLSHHYRKTVLIKLHINHCSHSDNIFTLFTDFFQEFSVTQQRSTITYSFYQLPGNVSLIMSGSLSQLNLLTQFLLLCDLVCLSAIRREEDSAYISSRQLNWVEQKVNRLHYDKSNSNAVIPTAQKNRGIRSALILIGFILIIVEIKFTAPRIEDTPAK